jgi:mRNA interferase MazF
MNNSIATVIVAPMSTRGRDYPSRVNCHFEGKEGQVILDQIRTVDKRRLVKKLGAIGKETQSQVISVLLEMFAD